jgi:ABC-type branched-subunit amino acid transport system substrate-binding protein
MALIPLALDGGADPDQSRRAAAKLSLDPTVRAVIGPLELASAAAAAEILAGRDQPWIVPALVAPAGGFPARPDAASLGALVAALIQAQSPPPARLLIAGLPAVWQPDDLTGAGGDVPLLLVDTPAALLQSVKARDAVLWLGLAHEGAALQSQLSAQGLTIPFWLGPAGDAAVFAAHMAEGAEAYWLIWYDPAYNSDSNPRSSSYTDLESLLVVQATCAALTTLEADVQTRGPVWELHSYRLNSDGTFVPVTMR